jgi:hypothetical protein
MPKYVIERDIPGAGQVSLSQLRAISQTSCGVLREHARPGGFPADRVSVVATMIEPTTAEE